MCDCENKCHNVYVPIPGPFGPTGPTGEPGTQGTTGSTGQSNGSIIPYASGLPVSLTVTMISFLPVSGNYGLIGFGSSVTVPGPLPNPIDLTGGNTILINFAFSAPRDGIITAFSGYFSLTNTLNMPSEGEIIINATLYESAGLDNLFMPTIVTVDFPSYFGNPPLGDSRKAIITGLNVPLISENRYLLVVSAYSPLSISDDVLIGGYFSGGLNIV